MFCIHFVFAYRFVTGERERESEREREREWDKYKICGDLFGFDFSGVYFFVFKISMN